MRPNTVRLSAAGFSPWLLTNHQSDNFSIGLGVKLSSAANLTYSVQHTMDNVNDFSSSFSATRVTTTATVTKVGHGLSVGDWILVRGAGAPFDGEYSVATVPTADTFTYTVANSGATSIAQGAAFIHTARVFNHSILLTKTTSQDGNYEFPPYAIRLNVSVFTGGTADLTVVQT